MTFKLAQSLIRKVTDNPWLTISKTRRVFLSRKRAFTWLNKVVDDGCVDNYRFAYLNDKRSIEEYAKQVKEGCCGFIDCSVRIGLRRALIGCNYGH